VRSIFADAGYWIALLNPRDALHMKARDMTTRLPPCTIVTSHMVLAELLTSFSAEVPRMRRAGAEWIDRLQSQPHVEIVPQTPRQFTDALELYRQRLDKDWSLTDCTSFQIMWDRGITQALAHDRHFEQAGFIALLRQ
jgi:uncharacterized protein